MREGCGFSAVAKRRNYPTPLLIFAAQMESRAETRVKLESRENDRIGFDCSNRQIPMLIFAAQKFGGADGSRTHDLLNAIQALSQLSYGPGGGNELLSGLTKLLAVHGCARIMNVAFLTSPDYRRKR